MWRSEIVLRKFKRTAYGRPYSIVNLTHKGVQICTYFCLSLA